MQFFFDEEKIFPGELATRIARACEGLVYISETDAPITVFAVEAVGPMDASTLRSAIRSSRDARIEEVDFHKFFARLTRSEAWQDAAQREQKKKFLKLQTLLEENLQDLKVFKIGAIRVQIYAVGLDRCNNIIGIKTEAVET